MDLLADISARIFTQAFFSKTLTVMVCVKLPSPFNFTVNKARYRCFENTNYSIYSPSTGPNRFGSCILYIMHDLAFLGLEEEEILF